MLWIAAGLLVALHVLLAWLIRDPEVLTVGDDAFYLLLARGLRSFSYRELYDVSHPIHNFYPPGYPAILAVWSALVGERFDALVLLSIGASAATLLLIFWALQQHFSPGFALLSLAALSVNPFLIGGAGALLSEPTYALVSLLALVLLVSPNPSRKRLALAGGLAILAALTRSIGVTLLIAMALHWLLERRFSAVATLAATALATVGLWFGWLAVSSRQAGTNSYFAQAVTPSAASRTPIGTVVDRLVHNVPEYLARGVPWRLPLPAVAGTWIDNVSAGSIVAVGLALGLVVLFRRWRPAALYLLIYAALLAIWPWRIARFLDPVLPLVVPTVILGIGTLVRPLGSRWRRFAMIGLALMITTTGTARATEMLREKQGCERGSRPPLRTCLVGGQAADQASFFAALRYINLEVMPDAVFLVLKRAPLYYYTGHLTISPAPALRLPPPVFTTHLQRAGVTHVLLSNLARKEQKLLAPKLQAICHELVLVRAFPPRTYLFRLGGGNSPGANGSACEALAEYRRAVQLGGANSEIQE